MGLELAKAYILIRADTRHLSADMAQARTNLINNLEAVAKVAGLIPTAMDFILQKVVAVSAATADLAIESMQAERRLEAALTATGHAAGFSSKELLKYANQLQDITTFDDELIIGVMTRLTMFRRVTGETFKRATEASLDLAARGLGTAENNALRLGRALEDPVNGLKLLRRTGIVFTEAEKDKIKRLQETNRTLDAQTMILGKVEAMTKGVAQALAREDAGRYEQLAVKIENVQEAIGQGLLPLSIRLREQTLGNSYVMLGFAKTIGLVADNTGQWIPNVITLSKWLKWLGLTFVGSAAAAQYFGITVNAAFITATLGVGAIIVGVVAALAAFAAMIQRVVQWVLSLKPINEALRESGERLSETFQAFGDVLRTTFGQDLVKLFGEGMAWSIRQLTNLIIAVARASYAMMMMGKIAVETNLKVTKALMTGNLVGAGVAFAEGGVAQQMALAKAMTLGDLDGAKVKPNDIPDEILLKVDTGRFGFRELGKHLQDAMLKSNRDKQSEQIEIGREGLRKQDVMIRELQELNADEPAGMLE